MTDKKLTDNEIIKALECCAKAKLNDDCRKLKCPFFDNAIDMCGVLNSEQVLIANSLDLINRQKSEIERLKTNLNVELENFATEYDNKIKAEAYKEFAERLKHIIMWSPKNHISITAKDIDNLLKELVGEDNASKN